MTHSVILDSTNRMEPSGLCSIGHECNMTSNSRMLRVALIVNGINLPPRLPVVPYILYRYLMHAVTQSRSILWVHYRQTTDATQSLHLLTVWEVTSNLSPLD